MTDYGSVINPMTLADALADSRIQSGHTLYLRGGVYSGDYVSTLVGVTIRPYEDEAVVIDGDFEVNGAGCTIQDIEFRYSGWTTRETELSGSAPADMLDKNWYINAPTTVRRCRIHDVRQPGVWSGASGSLIEDCLIINQGWQGPDRAHGHSMYTQNAGPSVTTFRRCLFLGGYGNSINCYTEGGSTTDYLFEDCAALSTLYLGCLFGGKQPLDNITIRGLNLWNEPLFMSREDEANGVGVLESIRYGGTSYMEVNAGATWTSLTESDAREWPFDEVRVLGSSPWRTVIVYNGSDAASVAAPITGTYRNAFNWTETTTLAAGDALTLSGWSVATPIGASAPLQTHPGPAFGVWVVTG